MNISHITKIILIVSIFGLITSYILKDKITQERDEIKITHIHQTSQKLQKENITSNPILDITNNDVAPVIPEKSMEKDGIENMSEIEILTPEYSVDTITFAGGCFWCIEAFFQEEPGVVSAVSGYSGGDPERAIYKEVVKGNTGHREVVQVIYNPTQVSLERMMSIFWTQIDPTDPDGQFADKGFQYTTAIYYHNDEQKIAAEKSLQSLQESGLFEDEIVTQIVPFESFFEAEEYHQDYYQKSALRYNAYKKASGRADFIEEEWAKQAALDFLAQVEKDQEATSDLTPKETKKHWDDYTDVDIQAGLVLLEPSVYRIVVEDGTEPSYHNAYWDHKESGIYVDVVTGEPLFSSTHKYNSKTGWPSFWRGIDQESFELAEDTKLSHTRTEVRSRSGHLGHIFNDGPKEHGGNRYCINSASLSFVPVDEMVSGGYGDYMYLFEI